MCANSVCSATFPFSLMLDLAKNKLFILNSVILSILIYLIYIALRIHGQDSISGNISSSKSFVTLIASFAVKNKGILITVNNENVVKLGNEFLDNKKIINNEGILIDSWGNKIHWDKNGSSLLIISNGNDGILRTNDDITADLTSR